MLKARRRHTRRFTRRNIVLMIAVAAVVAAVLVANRQENVLAGRASVVDAGTLRVASRDVRLLGVVVPELHEPRGREARNALIELVRGQHVTCELEDAGSDHRVVGTCYAAGRDVAAELVRWGFARDCEGVSGGRYRNLEPQGADRPPLPQHCIP